MTSLPTDVAAIAASKLPHVGTTIFAVMSHLANEVGAINLGQGFPDFPIDPELADRVHTAMHAKARTSTRPCRGCTALLQALAAKVERLYQVNYDPATEITVTAGGTQAIFTAIASVVHSRR